MLKKKFFSILKTSINVSNIFYFDERTFHEMSSQNNSATSLVLANQLPQFDLNKLHLSFEQEKLKKKIQKIQTLLNGSRPEVGSSKTDKSFKKFVTKASQCFLVHANPE
jgi:hypothetical protein